VGEAKRPSALTRSVAVLGKVTPLDLRRSFCSLAARRGVDPVQAARLTGHSLDVFTRVYAGDCGKVQRDEARARILAGGCSRTGSGIPPPIPPRPRPPSSTISKAAKPGWITGSR